MKLSKGTLAFTVLTCVGATNIDHTFGDPPRNLSSIFNNERLQCTLYSSHSLPLRDGVQGTEALRCVTDNEILYTVTNVPANFFAGNPFVSGSFRISVLNSCVSETAFIINLSKGDGQILRNNLKNRMTRQKAERSLIVMRVIDGRSVGPTLTKEALADGIFGTNGDFLNLSSGYDNCSGGKQKFIPGVFADATDGVMDLGLTASTAGLSASAVESLARTAMDQVPNFNPDSYDHIMFVLDPSINLLAYAYINWKYSVFQDLWAARPSALIHELGHNLGYLHSGEGNDQYGDQSGLMGYSYSSDEGPVMCFNAAKSWHLNWYSNVDINPVSADGVELNLTGIDDYVKGFTDGTHTTVVKIYGGSEDLYLMYNLRKGVNSETVEFRDTVNIVAQQGRTAQSWTRAQLSTGGQYRVDNFGGTGGELVIKVCELVAGTPAIARTLIYHTNVASMSCDPTTTPVKSPTNAPVRSPTNAPVRSPTNAPVRSPTNAPVRSPTNAPVKSPTIAPVRSPTNAPVKSPTIAPVKSPTIAPVTSPTIAPEKSPTIAPEKSPTIAPEKSPTIAPVKSPTNTPVKSPTNTPVKSPTNAPVKTPVTSPTLAPVKPSDCTNDLTARFLLKSTKTQTKAKSCRWLSKRRNMAKLCEKKTKCTSQYPAAQVACPEVCDFCGECEQNQKGKFFLKMNRKNNPVYKKCEWLEGRADYVDICSITTVNPSSCQGLAIEVCPIICAVVSGLAC